DPAPGDACGRHDNRRGAHGFGALRRELCLCRLWHLATQRLSHGIGQFQTRIALEHHETPRSETSMLGRADARTQNGVEMLARRPRLTEPYGGCARLNAFEDVHQIALTCIAKCKRSPRTVDMEISTPFSTGHVRASACDGR